MWLIVAWGGLSAPGRCRYCLACHPARRMPPLPSPAIELRSSQLPSSTPIVPRAVTTPTGTALIFLVIRPGPLGNPLDGAGAAAGALCDSVGAAATSVGALLESV